MLKKLKYFWFNATLLALGASVLIPPAIDHYWKLFFTDPIPPTLEHTFIFIGILFIFRKHFKTRRKIKLPKTLSDWKKANVIFVVLVGWQLGFVSYEYYQKIEDFKQLRKNTRELHSTLTEGLAETYTGNYGAAADDFAKASKLIGRSNWADAEAYVAACGQEYAPPLSSIRKLRRPAAMATRKPMGVMISYIDVD